MSLLLTFGKKSVIQRAISVLRKFGTNAHAYIPGVGVLNGLTAGNYTDTAGTQFTTKDQFVGLDLDATGSLGAELVTNGGFDTDTGWTKGTGWTIADGVAIATSAASGAFLNQIQTEFVSGRLYRLTYTVVSCSAGGFAARFEGLIGTARSTPGTYSEHFLATGATQNCGVRASGTTTGSIDNISVKEVTGIHATQGTAGNKPVLRHGLVCRNYPSGDITLWSTTAAGTITGGQADPVGGTSAQLFSGANKNVYIAAGVSSGVLSGMSFTHAAHLYSPTGGTLTMGSAAGGAKTTLVTIPAGWSIATAYWTATETNGPMLNLNGSLTSVTVYRQGIYLGTVTASQILAAGGIPLTTSAKASAGTGPSYWEFGGDGSITDYLGLGSVPFQMSDDHWVVVASSCVASGAIYTVADLAGKSTGQRCAAIYYDVAGRIVAAWTDDTIAPKTITHGSSLAGVVSVATAVKIGNNKRLRINGVQSGSVESSVMGTTTINVGGISRSVWNAQYLNGNIYAVLCGKGAITDADLLLIEKLAANLAGVTLA